LKGLGGLLLKQTIKGSVRPICRNGWETSIAIGVKLDYCSFLEDLSMNKQRERLSNSVLKAEGD